jgi:hypothetical protein
LNPERSDPPDPHTPRHAGAETPRGRRLKTILWWLFGAVCLLAGIGSMWRGHYLSAPCYLVAAAVSMPPVARRLPWKIPDNWKYFLILAGLMGAALLANPPDNPKAPKNSGTAAETAAGGVGR